MKPRDGNCGLTFDLVNEILEYRPESGLFFWKKKIGDRSPAGKRAGGPAAKGHWRIKIAGHYYLAHRLAWLLMTGRWPVVEIDHKNLVRDDNRWENLREATHSQNHANCGLRSDNTTGFKGVTRRGGKFVAIAIRDGKRHYAGTFLTAGEASVAYETKSRELHGEFSRAA